MTKEPKISVIMSIYNEPLTYIKKAAASILNQTYKNIEFIIVSDNPDNHEATRYIEELADTDGRIFFIKNNKNIGLAMSLNKGIEKARGMYIARMDSDDISKTDRLSRELRFLSDGGYDVIGCLADKTDENDNVWDSVKAFPRSEKLAEKLLPVQNIIIHPTVLMKAEAVKALGGYRPFSSCQDYDLWLRMLSGGYKIGILNESLLFFRCHKSSVSAGKRYTQLLNENYIRALYKKRIKNKGKDGFSEADIKLYLEKKGANDKNKNAFENKSYEKYRLGLRLIKQHSIISGAANILSSLKAYTVRQSLKISIKARMVKRRLK